MIWMGLDLTPFHWQEVYFANPAWFALLLVLPILWLLRRYWPGQTDWDRLNQTKTVKFRHVLIQKAHFFQKQPGLAKNHFFWAFLMQLLRLLILMALIMAMANPQRQEKLNLTPQTETVRDIVFVVESSVSFSLNDYQLNGHAATRMTVVKSVLDQFISQLEGNRFSWILFADQAYTLMPLTTDSTTARLMLKRLRPYLAGRDDEGMGEALGLALQQAKHKTKTTQKRIVVLISDGLSRQSRVPIQNAIDYAKALKLPIYTIGVGAGDASADKRQFSGLIYQPLDSVTLKTIAEQTGGKYFQIGSGADLQTVLTAISRSEGTEIKTPVLKHKIIYLAPLLLLVALGLMILYSVLLLLGKPSKRLEGEAQ